MSNGKVYIVFIVCFVMVNEYRSQREERMQREGKGSLACSVAGVLAAGALTLISSMDDFKYAPSKTNLNIAPTYSVSAENISERTGIDLGSVEYTLNGSKGDREYASRF